MEAACSAVGLDPSTADVARLTQTGGLPYHGGPGSNYSCHGLCAVVERLRTDLYRGEMGVVGANGGILTEHSVGVYSTTPPDQVIPTPSHLLDRISPIFSPFFARFHRLDGTVPTSRKPEPRAKKQWASPHGGSSIQALSAYETNQLGRAHTDASLPSARRRTKA